MSGISLLRQKMREKMGTARGLSEIPEVTAEIALDTDFAKHITKMDKLLHSFTKSLKTASIVSDDLAKSETEIAGTSAGNLESYRRIRTLAYHELVLMENLSLKRSGAPRAAVFFEAVSEYETLMSQLQAELATKVEQEIADAFKEMVNETLVDAKQQISMFEKLRLASDAAASELASLEKKAGTNEAKLVQARAVADQKRKEFLDMGEETREVLSQLHLALEATSIDLLCNYLEILSNNFNNAVRVASEMVPLIFQTKTHIEELREKHVRNAHARQSGDYSEAPKNDYIFGRPLEELLKLENQPIPNVVSSLMKHIETKYIDAEGLYWRSIPATELVATMRGFDKIGAIPDPDVLQTAEHASSLLKAYFRELPEPLLTHNLFNAFTETNNVKDSREKAAKLAAVAQRLPEANRKVAGRLFHHLHQVCSNGSVNLMSAGRLATAWATILLVPPPTAKNANEDPFEVRAVVESVIENAPLVFP